METNFRNDGKLKLMIIVGTRPELIRLSAVIRDCRKYFDTLLVHTGQNYDYNLNGVFFKDLGIAPADVYLDAVGSDLGETMGNIIARSYSLMAKLMPDAVLVLGDTNSCLAVIGAKRLHIPIFHMEAGNRCKDECLPEETNRRIVDIISDVNLAYSEHARRYLADCGLPKERTYVTGSPMAQVLRENLAAIEASDIHARLGLTKGKYILLSAHREENIDTEKNFTALFSAINALAQSPQVPGRMELVSSVNNVQCFVDYAHTPDAVENVCKTMKALCRNGRLITIFGCGGDRDRTKRPLMGEAAARYSDLCIVTSDNPRSEDPEQIIDEIMPGIPTGKQHRITDREEAIRAALEQARPGDAILIAGKGHENYQIFATETIDFSDSAVVRKFYAEKNPEGISVPSRKPEGRRNSK